MPRLPNVCWFRQAPNAEGGGVLINLHIVSLHICNSDPNLCKKDSKHDNVDKITLWALINGPGLE